MEKIDELLQELSTKKNVNISPIKNGSYETLESFWENFLKPLLPDKSIVLKWHELLMKYVNDSEAIFAIRAYHNWPNKKHNDTDLRRGFYTKINNKDYSFFFTDNYFATYFEKMLSNNYVPDYNSFKASMLNHQFPARFGRSTKAEKSKALYDINAKNDPGFQKNGYKLSHLVDVGNNYWINNENFSLTRLLDIYELRGKYSDWKRDTYNSNNYVRHMTITDNFFELKKIMVAHFLRFIHPFNYILTPRKSFQSFDGVSITRKDIGEYQPLLDYISNKYHEMYGDAFVEYKKLLLSEPKSQKDIKINLTITV